MRTSLSPCFLLSILFFYYLFYFVFLHSRFKTVIIKLLGLECLLNPGIQLPPALHCSSPDLPFEPPFCFPLGTFPGVAPVTLLVSTKMVPPIQDLITPPALPDFLFAVCMGGSFRGVPPLKEGMTSFRGVPPVKEAINKCA